eukprot:TRINITY_DN4244_c0_g1_i1.p1 TRINITY_DN4244_c0_g1~~TRINITY_DN4244_c0_g1_i1.p1  ORF type:complete len:228 (+),score=40.37 TRINITY_DN4244_c0_g1_i1:129-812(+)
MDPWIKEFDRLTRLADEISTDITEKTRLQKRGEDVGRLNYVIQNKVSTLVSEVAALQNALTPDPRLPPQEFRNRQDMLQKLLSRTDQLRSFGASSNNGTLDDSRSQLLGDGKKPRAWRTAQETEHTKGKTNTGVLQLQNEIMEQQDRVLDGLSDSISRQREIALGINDELDVHTRLLDHMDPKVTRTTVGVARETERVMSFTDKASTGFMWCIIILLVISIIVLVAV